MLCILLADDESAARYGLKKALASDSCEIVEAENGQEAVTAIRSGRIDLVFLDLSMPVLDGRGVLDQVQSEIRQTEIIVVTADDSVPSALECIRLGAADYLTKPYELERIRAIVSRAATRVSLEQRLSRLEGELEQKQAFGALVGVSRVMRDLFEQMQRAAKAPIDILLHGETGTGKELLAREIHRLSPRCDGPFVAVNTAAIAETLAESELFGHERGAFTGAIGDRVGVFQQANGGTLFLDEIGDMPLPAQTKILRALQERSVQPVGGDRTIDVDVRVITATHQDLQLAIQEGRFRQDLFYRIKGFELRVPPLRTRREDILLLANYFLERHAPSDTSLPQFDTDSIDRMLNYAWPGNVRELEHAVTAAATMATKGTISAVDLDLPNSGGKEPSSSFEQWMDLPLREGKAQLVDAYERHAIEQALRNHEGNVSAAARQLGLHRQSLQQKMTHLGITRNP